MLLFYIVANFDFSDKFLVLDAMDLKIAFIVSTKYFFI